MKISSRRSACSTVKDPRSQIEKYVDKYWEQHVLNKEPKLSTLEIDT